MSENHQKRPNPYKFGDHVRYDEFERGVVIGLEKGGVVKFIGENGKIWARTFTDLLPVKTSQSTSKIKKSKPDTTPTKTLERLHGCGRCDGFHENLKFFKFTSYPIEDKDGARWDYWAICPATGDPILMREIPTPKMNGAIKPRSHK